MDTYLRIDLNIGLKHSSSPPSALLDLKSSNISGSGIAKKASICFFMSFAGNLSASNLLINSTLSLLGTLSLIFLGLV